MELWYIGLFLYLLFYNRIFFNIVNNHYSLTDKQKSYVLSFRNAIVLSIFAILFNIYYIFYGELFPNMSVAVLIYFTSYLVSDLIIGAKEYPENISLIEGYVHHIIYIIINIWVILYNFDAVPFYMLFFLAEIPTALLGYYNLFEKNKNKKLYSNLFLIFRIVAMIGLIVLTLNKSVIKYFALPILGLHLYWYRKSIKKN